MKGLGKCKNAKIIGAFILVALFVISLTAVVIGVPSVGEPTTPTQSSSATKVEAATVKLPYAKGPGVPEIRGADLNDAESALGYKPQLPTWMPGTTNNKALLLQGSAEDGSPRVVYTIVSEIMDENGNFRATVSFAQSRDLRVRGIEVINGRFTSTSFGNPNIIKDVKKISVAGREGYYANDSGESLVVWAKDNSGFSLSAMGLSESELLRIAESIQ